MDKVLVRVNAGIDRNGNPRRGWLVMRVGTNDLTTAIFVGFIDEGYAGWEAVKKQGLGNCPVIYAPYTNTGEYQIPVRTYREYLKRRYEGGVDECRS